MTGPDVHRRGSIRLRRIRCGFLVWLTLTVSSSAAGQTAVFPNQPLLGSTFDADFLRDLPTSNNPFAVPETIQNETIVDGFTAGGLSAATAPRFGAFLNSWTQTQFRIGDITVTDPRAGGTPLFLPTLSLWERLTTTAAAMGVDDNASGVSMAFQPLRPGTTWSRVIEGSLSGSPLVSDGTGPVPVVDRVQRWLDASALVSGPVTDRLGLVAGGSLRGLSHVAAPSVRATSDRVVSGYAHLVLTATPRDEVRALGLAQRVTTAAVTDTVVHVQSTWERHDPARAGWRVFGGYTERRRSAPVASTFVVDSLVSDPVSDLLDTGAGSARRWVLGARATPQASQRLPTVGVELEGARVYVAPTGIEQIGELVDGAPARLWMVHPGVGKDVRHVMTLAAYGNKQLTLSRLTLDAGLRLDTMAAAAHAATRGIGWTTWLPRGLLRLRLIDRVGLSLVAGYRRSAYQLPLNVLSIGNPAAPVADVAVWNGTSGGPLIARVGPGTGGDPAFTQIDPHLRRPTTDEFALALEARLRPGLHVQLTRVTKREQPLLRFVDTGVASSEYSSFQVPDFNFLPDSSVGAPFVTVYERPPDSYGRDRYQLTNQVNDPGKSWGAELSVRASTDRFVLLGIAALTWARGPAAAVGFLPTQNDLDVVGNTFVDPNAATHVRGQLFPDRSHVVKIAGIGKLPWGIRLGAIARYQDGQPFARLVVVPQLTQGTVTVRSFKNGGSAFTFAGTLDIRVQRVFTTGRTKVAAVVDVYNLPGLREEVVEYVVSGPRYRTPTALQPARTGVIGVRVTF